MPTDREEDYLEAILHVERKEGNARVGDIARHLDCSAATVTEMFIKLSRKGLVNYERYGGVTLTDEGRRIGEDIDMRHSLIRDLLLEIGIDEHIADEDACIIEHKIHPQTMTRIKMLLEMIRAEPQLRKRIASFEDDR